MAGSETGFYGRAQRRPHPARLKLNGVLGAELAQPLTPPKKKTRVTLVARSGKRVQFVSLFSAGLRRRQQRDSQRSGVDAAEDSKDILSIEIDREVCVITACAIVITRGSGLV